MLASADPHPRVRMAVDAIGKVRGIAHLPGGCTCLLGSDCDGLAREEALIKGSGKGQCTAVAHRPERADEEAGATTNEPIGPAANARQRPALPAHLAGVEEEHRPMAAQIAFDPMPAMCCGVSALSRCNQRAESPSGAAG